MSPAVPLPAAPLLELRDLDVSFRTEGGWLRAVQGLSFTLGAGETLAIVGESGSGKSVSALSVMRLIPDPPGKITGGDILYQGQSLLGFSERQMRQLRGNDISMIFQEPMTSLNPVLSIGQQIGEAIRLHQGADRPEARARALDMLRLVQIPEAEKRLDAYPHALSGGMRQRVMIAMALACGPRILIADEPTTALDVTIQAQVLDLMRDLKDRTKAAILLITHDLGVVAEMAERVIVIYAGRKVEEGPVRDLLRCPRHPYTRGLLGAVPRLGASLKAEKAGRLLEIPGTVPRLDQPIIGCAFAPRCAYAVDRCHRERPPLEARDPGHLAACWRAHEMEPL
ncbi:ABC transporter ATP-binding protein [Iodidimonas nitroreducens]|uniref:ABC transporter ATP-binding protein n=1 Tax=Iodidimonas nitroreducens TaxID=1236968 RepID=A0A5A7NBB5_9PROT|nr:ABC transporter ATP-binding protein [Iodidimonas nitroreducens]GAK32726.1 putative peptide ABC transporter ATP-binding protein y4tR [alpha proteobacterium Q-1]GER04935.1 ABC transporter ATP-binding protein [Iodidimonas nitroreducens]